jgi:hypothetical protein
MSPALKNYPNRLEQIVADNRNIYESGNKFILPVIPVRGFQQQFWERYFFLSILVVGVELSCPFPAPAELSCPSLRRITVEVVDVGVK